MEDLDDMEETVPVNHKRKRSSCNSAPVDAPSTSPLRHRLVNALILSAGAKKPRKCRRCGKKAQHKTSVAEASFKGNEEAEVEEADTICPRAEYVMTPTAQRIDHSHSLRHTRVGNARQ